MNKGCPKCSRAVSDEAVFCEFCGQNLNETVTEKKKRGKRANGEGCVYKENRVKSKPWRAAYKKKYIGRFAKKKEADEACTQYINLYSVSLGKADTTVDDAFNIWISAFQKHHTKNSTDEYKSIYNKYFGEIKATHLRLLLPMEVEDIITKAENEGKSSSYRTKIKQIYSNICKVGVELKVLVNNDSKVLRPINSTSIEKTPLSLAQLMEIDKLCATSDVAKIIMILCYTGFRISEFFLMEKKNVHLGAAPEDNYMIGGVKTKKGRNRVIPIHPAIQNYVEYFYNCADGEYFVSGYNGNRSARNFRKRDFAEFVNKEPFLKKLNFTPHCCRHTFATIATKSHLEDKAKTDILGHVDVDFTNKVYVHSDLQYLAEEIRRIPSPGDAQEKE